MLKVILCDDNPHVLDFYENMMLETAASHHIDIKIARYESGEQLLFNLSDSPNSADIIYLDILMGQTNGIETARKLREIGCKAILIYLTSSNEYVFEAFDSNPFYYIVKDEMPAKKFMDIFLKAADSVELKRSNFIMVTAGGSNIKLSLDRIKYFDIQNRLITAHTTDGNVEYYSTMDELEGQLMGRDFVRVHRSFLANCYYIQRLTRTQLILNDGAVLPVSAKYTDTVKEAFSNYLVHV